MPLPAAIRRKRVPAHVCVQKLQGVYPDSAADAVFADAAGGSGHGDGGSCVRRMAVFLYVASGEANDAGADGGGLVRPAEPTEIRRKQWRYGQQVSP